MGPYDPVGRYTIENLGVLPDIKVNNRPDDMIRGLDQQLERSIEEMMKQLETHSTQKAN